jgi:hypothetical protein
MSADAVVRWSKKSEPSKKEIGTALKDYVGNFAYVFWNRDRFYVHLPGNLSFPFRRVGPATVAQRKAWKQEEGIGRRRWFEVYIGEGYIDVITRQMDEVTSVVARGFAALCVRGWKGRMQ